MVHHFPQRPAVRISTSRLSTWFLLAWFFLMTHNFLRMILVGIESPPHSAALEETNQTDNKEKKDKILYIVTSMSEYDNGQRNTQRGRDRFQETVVRVTAESAESMLSFGYDVDVYLITHYELKPERQALLRQSLPSTVGLEIWEDATPLSYSQPGEQVDDQDHVQSVMRALSRQHRFVIKDKLLHYDFFVAFEDDMLIKGHHVQHYMDMSRELQTLQSLSTIPRRSHPKEKDNERKPIDQYYGNLTKVQLARLMPGLIRVEVTLDKVQFAKYHKRQPLSLPPLSSSMTEGAPTERTIIDTEPCCHRDPRNIDSDDQSLLRRPPVEDVYLWETEVIALGLHKMPNITTHKNNASSTTLDWVVLQRGLEQTRLKPEKILGEYWTGRSLLARSSNVTIPRPDAQAPQYINNQGGWMASRDQIARWHQTHCRGQLLPPYYNDDEEKDHHHPKNDGLKNNVEYWSGGLSLVGTNGCQLQRIVSLKPEHFSKHLVYHTTNNKQKRQGWPMTNVQHFWEQLYSVQLDAEARIPVTL